jgi:RNA polymerase sigma factor (sigma-70 family)
MALGSEARHAAGAARGAEVGLASSVRVPALVLGGAHAPHYYPDYALFFMMTPTLPNYPSPLPHDEQAQLCQRAQAGDIAARNRLVTHSMRMVVGRAHALRKIAAQADINDLVHEGVFGLMRAIDKFDPNRGANFNTYAGQWVDNFVRRGAYAQREINASDSSRGSAMVRDYGAALSDGLSHEQAVEHVARTKRMKAQTVLHLVEIMRRRRAKSTDAPIAEDAAMTFGDTLTDHEPSADQQIERDELNRVTRDVIDRLRCQLDERCAAILDRRILADDKDSETLDELGRSFGVSKERIRQLETSIARRLRTAIRRSTIVKQALGIETHALTEAERESARVYARSWWLRRKKRGLCVCGRKARAGHATCGAHTKSPEQTRDARAESKKVERCTTHTNRPVEPGKTRCALCNERKRKYAKRKRAERKASGQCRWCTNASSTARCEQCKKTRQAQRCA